MMVVVNYVKKGHVFHRCPITNKTEYNNYCSGNIYNCGKSNFKI